jgi:hypothetical protein
MEARRKKEAKANKAATAKGKTGHKSGESEVK